MFKRAGLFLLTNALIILTLSIILNLLGVQPYLTPYGLDLKALLIFCFAWGFIGALISLAISRIVAKFALKVQLIDPEKDTGAKRGLYDLVARLSEQAGLPCTPEVGIYDSPEVNAFATGPTKRRSLVAVSTGLLHGMQPDEVEAVLGHEITHVANGDMVTMTLVQGCVNAFALFLSRVVSFIISTILFGQRGRQSSMIFYYLLTIVFDILFTLLGSMVTASFSRWREYKADKGSAKLVGREKMIAALKRLEKVSDVYDRRGASIGELKISHEKGKISLFATHPPLSQRIAKLQKMA